MDFERGYGVGARQWDVSGRKSEMVAEG